MRILLFNIYFHPDPTGTGLVMGELAADLAAIGHSVTVVTTVPHYGLDSVPEKYRGRLICEEQWNGVRIIRTGIYLPRRRTFFSRIINYLSYTLLAIPAALRAGKHDAVIGVWPPVTTGIAAAAVSFLRRTPLVINVQDVFPDALFRWKSAAWLSRLLERLTLRRAAAITVLSEGLRDAVVQRGAVPERVRIIPMWTNTDEIRPLPKDNGFRERHGLRGKFVVLYSGNLGTYGGIGVVLDAAAVLRDNDRIRFVIVGRGNGRDALLRKAADLNLTNTTFLDTRPREELPEMLAAADISLATLDPRLGTTNVPSKALTIMASARPVLAAMSPDNEIARIVARERCGWCVGADQPAALAQIVRSAFGDSSELEEMGLRGRRYVVANHRRPDLTGLHGTLLQTLVVGRRK